MAGFGTNMRSLLAVGNAAAATGDDDSAARGDVPNSRHRLAITG